MRLLPVLQFFLGSPLSHAPRVNDHECGVSYQGIESQGVQQFLGIKYGEDTSGSNRFAPPKPFKPQSGAIIDATVEGAACPQPYAPLPADPYTFVANTSEDCLSLRIARPSLPFPSKLPVMIWIHGGGRMAGNAYDPSYNPVGLVKQSEASGNPVIYVAMNYRTNIFGHAASSTLIQQRSANAGLRDQELGIKWVRDHIALFGGDPDNITLFGEESGAVDIGLHLIAYGGKSPALFHRAIAQSGAATSVTSFESRKTLDRFVDIAARVGCTESVSSDQVNLECMRQLRMEDLVNATFTTAWDSRPPNGFGYFAPVIDWDFIPDEPSKLFENGSFAQDVQYLSGWNMDEASVDVPTSVSKTSDAIEHLVAEHPNLSATQIRNLLSMYEALPWPNQGPVTSSWFAASRLQRDITVSCPSIEQSSHIARHSATFVYELNQTAFAASLAQYGKSYLGVVHFSDVPYVFNEVESLFGIHDPEELRLAALISGSWAAFAATGTPSGGGSRTLGEWPEAFPSAISEAGEYLRSLGVTLRVIGGSNSSARRLDPQDRMELLMRCSLLSGN